MEEFKGLEKFLGDIDNISEVIKKLNSAEKSERDSAIQEADSLLKYHDRNYVLDDDKVKTVTNRTVINKSEPNRQPAVEEASDYPDQESFMRAIEKDAEERALRRIVAKAEATKLKDEGNVAFKTGDYEKAIALYTKGLDHLKDFKELWTNRAQTYMKLKRYKEALSDCDWAQRCDEKFIKAYVLEAKALVALKEYDKAIEVCNKAKGLDKTKHAILDELIHEIELSRNSSCQERDVRKSFKSGARHPATVVEIMNKISSEGELPLYYDGGVRVLSDLIAESDRSCKALFRSEGGLEIYAKHHFFSRVMQQSSLGSLSMEELDACSGMFHLLQTSVTDEEESQKRLLMQKPFIDVIMKFLNPQTLKKKGKVKESCLNLMLTISESAIGRKYIATQFDVLEFLKNLFGLVSFGEQVAIKSFSIINNLALDPRLKKSLYTSMESALPAFETLLLSDKHTEVTPYCISIMTNLSTDSCIRKTMSSRQSMFDACKNYLNKFPANHVMQYKLYESAVYAVLGLLMNLTLDKNDALKSSAPDLCRTVTPYVTIAIGDDLTERVVGLLSHILPASLSAVQYYLSEPKWTEKLILLLGQRKYPKYTIKALTACTQTSKDVCCILANDAQAVAVMKDLIYETDEVLLGNLCLCLGHCSEFPSVHQSLDKESIKRLLVLLRDAHNSLVKQNCAILIGKLVKVNQSHLESLRELDGIAILHHSTKHYKL